MQRSKEGDGKGVWLSFQVVKDFMQGFEKKAWLEMVAKSFFGIWQKILLESY